MRVKLSIDTNRERNTPNGYAKVSWQYPRRVSPDLGAATYIGNMSNLPISSKYRSAPGRPVDEAERTQLTQRLNDAYAEGRLDVDDYQRRMDQLFTASTLGELVEVVDGLPASAYRQPGIVDQGISAPGEVSVGASAHRFALLLTASLIGLIAVAVILLVLLL